MLNTDKRKYIDTLINNFWKLGFMTVKRKFGTYLPEPEKIGAFDVDIIARQKDIYAIGVTLSEDEIKNPRLLEKITFLATRHTKFSNKKVLLFLGVPSKQFKKVKLLIEELPEDVQISIKIISIAETTVPSVRKTKRKKEEILFT